MMRSRGIPTCIGSLRGVPLACRDLTSDTWPLIFDPEALRAPAQSPCSLRIYLLLALI